MQTDTSSDSAGATEHRDVRGGGHGRRSGRRSHWSERGGRWPWTGGARTRGRRRIPCWCSACGRAPRNAAPVLRQEEEGGSPQHPRPGKTLNSLPLRVPPGPRSPVMTVITTPTTGLLYHWTGETEEQTRQNWQFYLVVINTLFRELPSLRMAWQPLYDACLLAWCPVEFLWSRWGNELTATKNRIRNRYNTSIVSRLTLYLVCISTGVTSHWMRRTLIICGQLGQSCP